MTSEIATSMKECGSDGPVSVHVTKLYHATDAQSFRAFGRVLSGTLRKGAQVKVLGEGYSPQDEEDMMIATVDDLWVSGSRFVSVSQSLTDFGTYKCLRPDISSRWKKFQRVTSS